MFLIKVKIHSICHQASLAYYFAHVSLIVFFFFIAIASPDVVCSCLSTNIFQQMATISLILIYEVDFN